MKIISEYSDKGVEKVMLIREVILRAVAKIYTWNQAADILGYTPRHMSRIKKRYEQYGFNGLFDRRTKNMHKTYTDYVFTWTLLSRLILIVRRLC
jgi:hypothetical protein